MSGGAYSPVLPDGMIDQHDFIEGKGSDEELIALAKWLVENDPLAPEGGWDTSKSSFVLLADYAVIVTQDLEEAAFNYTLAGTAINPGGRNVEVFLSSDGSTHVVHSLDEVFQLAGQFGIMGGGPSFSKPDLAA